MVLDDLKMIHQRDAQDALGIAGKQGEQLLREPMLTGSHNFGNVYNVVYAGVGDDALAADVISVWPRLGEPFQIVRGYELPGYVDQDTLVIVASYSGEGKEALSMLAQAEAKGAQIAVIASQGMLTQIAGEKGYLLAALPSSVQTRFNVGYMFRALLEILAIARLFQREIIMSELAATATQLASATAGWRPDVVTAKNPAKLLAQECVGKSLVIYGGSQLAPAAYRWKIGCNENAKHVAWWGQYPEAAYTDLVGWSKHPVDKPYAVITLRSSFEHERVQQQFAASDRVLSGLRPMSHLVQAEGATMLQQLLWTIAFGDFVTIYLALLNGVNPTPIDVVEKINRS